MTGVERAVYITAVWAEYMKLTGRERMCSNIEYSLARWWAVEGFPLRVVLQAMSEAGKTPRTLLWYEQPVAAEYDRWRKAMVS